MHALEFIQYNANPCKSVRNVPTTTGKRWLTHLRCHPVWLRENIPSAAPVGDALAPAWAPAGITTHQLMDLNRKGKVTIRGGGPKKTETAQGGTRPPLAGGQINPFFAFWAFFGFFRFFRFGKKSPRRGPFGLSSKESLVEAHAPLIYVSQGPFFFALRQSANIKPNFLRKKTTDIFWEIWVTYSRYFHNFPTE